MKKVLLIGLISIIATFMVACGGSKSESKNEPTTILVTEPETTAVEEVSEEEEPTSTEVEIYAIGDTVESEYYRFTLKDACLTDKILVCHGKDANKSSFVNSDEFFTATDEPFVDEEGYLIDGIHGFSPGKDSDEVFLYYNFEFEFIGKEERTVVDLEFAPIVKYNDEYKFDSDYFSMYRTKKGESVSEWSNFNSDFDMFASVKALGLEIGYFSGTIKPLTSDIYEVRGIIPVPKQIKEDNEGKLILDLCGKSFLVK